MGKTMWLVQINDELKSDGPSVPEWKRRSIYKVPSSVTELNKKAYKPQVVSFGPYHNREEHLKGMEEHKHRALIHFLKRCEKPIKDIFDCMDQVVEELRDSYNPLEPIWMHDTPRFLQMMILDGCFMLEILRSNDSAPDNYADDDPVFGKHGKLYVVPYIKRDMLMLENQLPLMVLCKLIEVETDKTQGDELLIKQILKFFFSPGTPETGTIGKCMHVLDVYRKSLIQQGPTQRTRVSKATRRRLWSNKCMHVLDGYRKILIGHTKKTSVSDDEEHEGGIIRCATELQRPESASRKAKPTASETSPSMTACLGSRRRWWTTRPSTCSSTSSPSSVSTPERATRSPRTYSSWTPSSTARWTLRSLIGRGYLLMPLAAIRPLRNCSTRCPRILPWIATECWMR
ncbi:UPF0481 protein [Spatholobus suberectus]|nr:UPF0481 protein [Spatholobus suberectus]